VEVPEVPGKIDKSVRDVVLAALWTVPDCPDSSEVERACRSCEATVVAEAVLRHLIAVEEEVWRQVLPTPPKPVRRVWGKWW
jgi:hypothetical protein